MSSTSTRAPYGMFFTSDTYYGGTAPPMIDGCTTNAADFISDLSNIKAKGARAFWKFAGGDGFFSDSNKSFILSLWKARLDLAVAKTSAQQMNNFFLDGTVIGHVMVDDLVAGSPVYSGGAPTAADCEAMAAYSKSKWSMIPCGVRGPTTYMRDLNGGSAYTQMDFAWAQWRQSQGLPQTFYQNNINAGRQVGLGTMAGFNFLNGGSGKTAPYNTKPCGQGATQWGMAPDEITACGNAFSAITTLIGIMGWAHQCAATASSAYYETAAIQTAYQGIVNQAVGRLQGPINFRDVSGSTSGSTATVSGSWSFLGVGGKYATQNANSLTAYLPANWVPGCLIGIIAYSRDSLKPSVAPSGFSEALRVSGTSAQGGDLALYYKIAGATETDYTVSYGATSADQVAQMTRVFAFSGNASGQSLVLSTVGSKSSWASANTYGPIKGGLTSAASDALVVLIGARANDLGFTASTPPTDAISATTRDTETWNRAFIQDTGSGSDAAMFMDYTFLSGQPSITTKTHSQLSIAPAAATAGAGAGFMVSFKPLAVVAGTPPTIVDFLLDDAFITTSISSGVSFVATSIGSTPITWSLTSGPSNVTLGASTGQFVWTPLATGTYVNVIKATNSIGSDTANLTVVVAAAGNVAPVLTNPGNKSVAAHDLLSFTVQATDADNDTITYTLDPSAPEGTFVDPVTGQFIWIPTAGGVYPIVAIASDGQNTSRSTFTVTVGGTVWTRILATVANQFKRV